MLPALVLSFVLSTRPAYDISLPSARGFPLAVHGPTGSDVLLAKVRDAADRSWQEELVDGGWPAPPPDTDGPDDRFDLYLDPTMGFPEAYTMGDRAVASTPWFDLTSYIVLCADFPNDAALFSTVAHELNHASQYAMDAAEDDAFFEHTAVLVERNVANDFATWGTGVRDYQGHPERALTYMGTDWYEYGAGLWVIFLSERLDQGGYGLARRLWNDSKQPGTTNRPHFLNALDGLLQERGWTRRRFFSELSVWRYFTGARDDHQHFGGASGWGASSLVPVERRGLEGPLHLEANLGGYGAKLVELTLPASAAAVTVEVDSVESGAALVPLSDVGAALTEGVVSGDGGTTLRLELPSGTALVLGALTNTPGAYDPNARPFALRLVSADFTVELSDGGQDSGVEADAGITPPTPPRGCGCTAGGGLAAWALAFVVAWWLRTRRTRP